MLSGVLRSLFGSVNDRTIKQLYKKVHKINELEASTSQLTDDELRSKTVEFKESLAQGKSLDDLLIPAFAVVREAAKRTLGMRPFDVQLIGGMVLHEGKLAEMKTGEGKTLVATLPVYLNALTGKGVHVITVNDYLVTRDAAWMGRVYEFLGLSVGCIVHGLTDNERRKAYACDITYGTNHEFGFDYLRDNMKFSLDHMVMRPFNYTLIDEVDSILIDEARTPLIISGPAEDSSEMYEKVDKVVKILASDDFEKDEKQHSVLLTEKGIEKVEAELKRVGLMKGNSLYDVHNISLVHHITAALKAQNLYKRDDEYIVRDGEIVIIDEFTGRMMDGRRYSDGLHQAIEAKEGVPIKEENQTLASITYQNFFRLYPKLSGMAGTAMTEAPEFEEIYSLDVVEIPPNVPVQRKDLDDEIYLSMDAKYRALLKLVKECVERKQPVLIGTTSIEKSEEVSNLLKKEKIVHNVLNARQHMSEAEIVAEAGCPGAVTVATNMAGRGTDIKLGGNAEMRIQLELKDMPEGENRLKEESRIHAEVKKRHDEVIEAGGLYIIGTERHESRRIDNQLRGRSGRQGDPGASKFFISLQDDLMRIFGASQKLDGMLRRLGAEEDEVISHKWISRSIEKAQQKVEARNFDIRKHLLKYDDVMNDQRKIIYAQRRELMATESIQELIEDMTSDVVNTMVDHHFLGESVINDERYQNFCSEVKKVFSVVLPLDKVASTPQALADLFEDHLSRHIEEKAKKFDTILFNQAQRNLLLRLLDQHWKDHLLSLDHLRHGINLRAYAQSNPLNEYKREAFNMFQSMLDQLRTEFITFLCQITLDNNDSEAVENLLPELDFDKFQAVDTDVPSAYEAERSKEIPSNVKPITKQSQKVPRNAVCPCGSGKKYKHCHGAF